MKLPLTQSLQPRPLAEPLQPCNLETVQWEKQAIELAIARRAYELFEAHGREPGHDWEHWFQAESELLRPVSVVSGECAGEVSVRANVMGFEPGELKFSIEPRRITIVGKRETSQPRIEGGKNVYIDLFPDRILQVIDLPKDIDPAKSKIELRAGVLGFELAAPSKPEATPVARAA